VENFFQRVKRYRRVATRYEKLAKNYLSMVAFAAVLTWPL
jgi:transposase